MLYHSVRDLALVLASMALLLTPGCVVESTETPLEEPDVVNIPEDPPGTITTNLLIDQYNNRIDFESGQVNGDAALADIVLDTALNLEVHKALYQAVPSINDAGEVLGLGALEALPAEGYSLMAAASRGHGYYVVTKERNAYRFYIDEILTYAESGGVSGIRIKWALLKANVLPGDPILLTANLAGDAISVSWSAAEGSVDRYRLFYLARPTSSGQGNPSSDEQPVVDVATTSYTLSPVSPGMTYRFFVTAVYPWGETALPANNEWPTQVAVP